MSNSNLRSELRSHRRSLTPDQQLDAANRIADAFSRLDLHIDITRIGLYWPNDGEIDPRVLMQRLMDAGKACYLPILHPKKENALCFGEYSTSSAMTKNRYGIEEPTNTNTIEALSLDLILIPLVGFDDSGNRLGMGAGYYDRTLASAAALSDNEPRTPSLIGLAHSCQRVDAIEAQPWDIPMHAILTDQDFIKIQRD